MIVILFFLQLYTTSTVALVLQSVYYDYVCRWLKYRQINANHAVQFDFIELIIY